MDVAIVVERIARGFTVCDLMVSWDQLVTAQDSATAVRQFDEHEGYDVIPIQRDGAITAYVQRGSNTEQQIGVNDLVGDAASVFDLVSALVDRRFCFVVGRREVVGFVHYADLNSPVVKLPFFALIEATESMMASAMRPEIDITLLASAATAGFVDPSVPGRVVKQHAKQKSAGADRDHVDLLGFGELLEMARYTKAIELSTDDCKNAKDVRNSVCHAKLPLVQTHDDIRKLVQAKHTCDCVLVQLARR